MKTRIYRNLLQFIVLYNNNLIGIVVIIDILHYLILLLDCYNKIFLTIIRIGNITYLYKYLMNEY
jgi:hypothetical protein